MTIYTSVVGGSASDAASGSEQELINSINNQTIYDGRQAARSHMRRVGISSIGIGIAIFDFSMSGSPSLLKNMLLILSSNLHFNACQYTRASIAGIHSDTSPAILP